MFVQVLLVSIFLLPLSGAFSFEDYRFKLDIGNPNVFCPEPNYACPNGQLHYLCMNDSAQISPQCRGFSVIPMSNWNKKLFVLGTNGIRNKIAGELGISNMNILYWSEEISRMAETFLRQCVKDYDPCKIFGERHIELAQNFVISSGKMGPRFPAIIVRQWFLQLGTDVKNWRDYKKKFRKELLTNITTMIYPPSEFMGCSAARMFDSNFVTCYYHPPFDPSTFPEHFENGNPCTNCSEDRSICSQTFVNLCGFDYEMSGSSFLSAIIWLLMGSVVVIL